MGEQSVAALGGANSGRDESRVPTMSDVDAIVAAAARAAGPWAAASRPARSRALRTIADHLDSAAAELVSIAARETHLSEDRLRSELRRTTFQLRLFAEVVADGSYVDVRIDHADPDWPMGAPRPDLRRLMQPLGPVLVFAASNFPFAFSVAGGDTASALAAGCPVVVKVHPGHPELSAATAEQVMAALADAGAPEGVFAIIAGVDAGVAALQAPQIKAASFTGSIAGGRALFDIATRRPEPIPFYGELGSVNPVFVTRAAAASRLERIVSEFIASFTLGAGQFCTKPGVLLAPRDSKLAELLREAAYPAPAPLLNRRIQDGYTETLRQLVSHPSVSYTDNVDNFADPPSPTVLTIQAADLIAQHDELFRECFGPTAIVASYDSEDELLAMAEAIDGQLTATIIGEDEGDEVVVPLMQALALKAGRLLWNAWPTGVSVTYAQHHGGPYPATTSPTSTSVGTAAIARFLRPVAYQNFPQQLLPAALRDDAADLPRRVDGRNLP
jgi:NADP-dependent aldehyde dehydrogenase